MKTIWNGEEFIINFDTGLEVKLNLFEIREFDDWVKERVESHANRKDN